MKVYHIPHVNQSQYRGLLTVGLLLSLMSHELTVKQHDVVGVDLGVKELCTLSTGVVFPNPKHYKTHLEKLRRLSRKFARKAKGSNNRHKAKMRLAKHHLRIANLRKDTLHQITTFLCKNHAKIVVEDLNVSGMLSNHKLAQVIAAKGGFHEFKRQLEYKAKKFGCEIIIASCWFPSSKTCSRCGHIQDMPLKERTYNCKSCGYSMDRDLNAAINLSQCVAEPVRCGGSPRYSTWRRVPRVEAPGVSRLAAS